MLIQDIMTKSVVTIDCNETVLNACKSYKDYKVGCLVVMDKKIIVGIVTERDIIERAILADRDLKQHWLETLCQQISRPFML